MQAKDKILIIEDDRILTSTIKEILIDEGYVVEVAESASMAQPLLSSAHLALIDLRLPDKRGVDALRELKQVNPQAEALIITGYADMRSAIECLNLGAFAYLEKPINPEKLLLFIKRAMESRRLTLEVMRREQEIKGLTGFTGTILNERVRLLEQAKEREERLSRLYRGISLSFRSFKPLQAARELLPLIAEATEANYVAFTLIGTDKQMSDRVEYFRNMEPFKVESRSGGIREEVLRTARPVVVSNLAKYPNPNPSLIAAGIKSTAVYPLIVDDVIYGILSMHSLKEKAFEEQEEAIASFADLCAIPLRQSILWSENEKARRDLEIIVNEVKVGIVLVDTDRKIIRANNAFAKLIGKPLEKLPGKKVCELIHGHPEPIPSCPLEKAVQTGESSSAIFEEPSLGIKRLEAIITPVKLASGKISHFVHIFRNLDMLGR